MNPNVIQNSFKKAVAGSVRLQPEGVDRYLVFTPFHFDDGDHFVIILKRTNGGGWVLTDEGHTYMHMSYRMDVSSLAHGTRNALIESALEKHDAHENGGQILARIDDFENAGNVFYNYIQCLVKITDVAYLNRKRVASMFMEDFRQFISKTLPPQRMQFDYFDESHDPKGQYRVDCRINGMPRPVHVYAIKNDSKCRDTTISILNFQKWKVPCFSLGIFEDQAQINRKVLARFTDVCDRQFSSLAENQKGIATYLQEQVEVDSGR